MYRPVRRSNIFDALMHIRDLYRQVRPRNDRELRAHDRRETAIRYLLSNLERTSEHPTLKTVLEIRETCGLTLEGAHRLFGYDLEQLRECDLQLNGRRTHIIESYPFGRDRTIELPVQFAPHASLQRDRPLREVVTEWQSSLPIKTLEEEPWSRQGVFYVHVGTEDSLGSSIPPGATALVEPIDRDEALRPNPRRIYLLQFGTGYRCSHCVATQGRLHLFNSGRTYLGRESFSFPGSVRDCRAHSHVRSAPAYRRQCPPHHVAPVCTGSRSGPTMGTPLKGPTACDEAQTLSEIKKRTASLSVIFSEPGSMHN